MIIRYLDPWGNGLFQGLSFKCPVMRFKRYLQQEGSLRGVRAQGL